MTTRPLVSADQWSSGHRASQQKPSVYNPVNTSHAAWDMSKYNKDAPGSEGGGKAGMEEDEDMFVNRSPPVFTEMLLRMIEELSDDLVSWSIAGDSFIIKQLPAFEAFLPSYFGSGKFSSFARQLNNYGFRRAKRTPSPPMSSTGGGVHDAATAAATTRGSAWGEFNHPLFRRGRRDLLAGVKRHKHNRHKHETRRKPGEDFDARESDMLNSLRADVDALSGDLKTVNVKLESIMSLLSDVAGGQNQTAPNTTSHGGGGFGFQGGNFAGSAAAPAAVVHGGSFGVGEWIGGDGKSDGGIRGGGQEWGVGGAPPGYFVGPRVPVGHQQEGSRHYPFYPPPSQNPPSTQRYPVGPHQVRYGEAQSPLAEEQAVRTSESASTGPSPQHKTATSPT